MSLLFSDFKSPGVYYSQLNFFDSRKVYIQMDCSHEFHCIDLMSRHNKNMENGYMMCMNIDLNDLKSPMISFSSP